MRKSLFSLPLIKKGISLRIPWVRETGPTARGRVGYLGSHLFLLPAHLIVKIFNNLPI
jgi:hypothetical protein